LGSRLTGPAVAVEALAAWLNATPALGRHVTRIAKLDELDGLLSPMKGKQ
jgi:ribose 5-phosphate isomerase RpiB